MGERLLAEKAPNKHLSLLATCVELNVPISIHPALGTEIIHQHPNLDGAAFGEKALIDFRIFAHSLSKLTEGAIVLNVGSAVIMPEVFFTAVFDMIRHYRPSENVKHRPTLNGGKGYYFVGHHEIMIPLLAAALLD